MKSAFKKLFAGTSAQPATADNKEEANMATKEETAELQALLEKATTSLAAKEAQLAEMSAMYEKAQAALKSAEDIQASMAKEAAQKRLDARRQAVVASVGTARADALLAATDALDDSAFKAVVDAMANSFEVEAKNNPAFVEAGVDAPEDKAAVMEFASQESEESKLLKAKYQSK